MTAKIVLPLSTGITPPPELKLYALDTSLNLTTPVTKAKLLQAMQGHILATAELMGHYTRHKP